MARPGVPKPLAPGDTIGILGGGQLGRMLSMAAARLGLRTRIYSDAESSPAAEVSASLSVGAYDDFEKLSAFAEAVDVVTYEFENVPVETAEFLSRSKAVYPPMRALEVTQDRLVEKQFISSLGIAVAPFAQVDDADDLEHAVASVGYPSILKTRRLGYDGKGQARLNSHEDMAGAWDAIGRAPAILEGFVEFAQEISVILVRGQSKRSDPELVELVYDLPCNTHKNGILDRSAVPAVVSDESRTEALEIAGSIAQALNYVGVLAVELFDPGPASGRGLVVNEIAPRVHNSGHWTMDACHVDQFENHIRAVAGWPIASPERHSDVEMRNLIGADACAWHEILQEDGASLHLYGKHDAREGRKMGHVNTLRPKS